jgi:hypothetical protein
MEKYFIEGATLKRIADAIRTKKGYTTPLPVTEFASEIETIESGISEDLNAVLAEQEEAIETLKETLRTKAARIPDGYLKPEGKITITESGTDIDVSQYEKADVLIVTPEAPPSTEVIPEGYIKPSGTKSITANGTHDVRAFESVSVNVPTSGGSSGGECTGEHINIVDELSEVGVEGAYYGLRGFCDIYIVHPEFTGLYVEMGAAEGSKIYVEEWDTFNGINTPDGYDMYIYYLARDEGDFSQDIYMFNGGIIPLSQIFGLSFKGEIADTTEATEQGYYAYMGFTLYQYTSGQYKALFKKGDLVYSSNGDGTCAVSGVGVNNDSKIVIPSVSPSGDTVTSIASYAFRGEWFAEITIPDTVTSIGEYAFADCKGLQNLTIPDSVTSIGENVCSSCNALKEVKISNNVTEIPKSAFYYCTSLEKVTFPSTLTTIGTYAFQLNRSLYFGYTPFPVSLTEIKTSAFDGCTYASEFNYEGTKEQWGTITKGDNYKDVGIGKVSCSDGYLSI